MTAPYPWQNNQWHRLLEMQKMDRFPHALLITGKQGNGLACFAEQLSASLLCDQTNAEGTPCQQCSSCKLLQANTHPELKMVTPEEQGKAIKIEAIRELIHFVQMQSHSGQKKIAIIQPADAMNQNAANSLLKILEEPSGNTLIILVTEQEFTLPVTIRSRCQKLSINASIEETKQWLENRVDDNSIEIASRLGLGPLFISKAIEEEKFQYRFDLLNDLEKMSSGANDPISVAESWSKNEIVDTVFWLDRLVKDMVKLRSVDSFHEIVNKDLKKQLQSLSNKLELKKLFKLHDKLFEQHRLLLKKTNVKEQTLFEEFTLLWVEK